MKRLFLAIDLPERIIDDISDTYQAIPGARWMGEQQLHITLRFYGDVPPDRENALVNALRAVTFPPFSLRLKGVGHFPPRREARLLWVGIAPEPLLLKLHSLVENASVKAGCEREGRRFSPHITVARLGSSAPDRVAQYLTVNNLFATEPFEVNGFHLYSSRLGKAGAHYTREASFSLEAPGLPL